MQSLTDIISIPTQNLHGFSFGILFPSYSCALGMISKMSAKHSSLSGFGRSTVYQALPVLVFNPQRQAAEIKGNEHTKVQHPSFARSADVLI